MQEEGMVVENNVACPMRDGTNLKADVYRPNDQGIYPVLMIRLPYDKTTKRYYDEYLEVPRMVAAGYVVILQDVRGRFASDGEFYPFIDEGKDGYDSVEWAAKLPYANGRVGLFGMSYHGYTQLAAATEQPPSLQAIAPVMTMADPWNDLLGADNEAVSSANFQTWTLGSMVEDQLHRRHSDKDEQVQTYMYQLPQLLNEWPAEDWRPMQELDPTSFYFDVMKKKISNDKLNEMELKEKLPELTIPALFMGGWYDALLTSTLEAYQQYGGPTMLWIGPWTHEEMTGRAGEVTFQNAEKGIGVDEIADPTALHIAWFDKWLKDKPFSIDKPVHLYMMGQSKWEAFDKWPPRADEKIWYLTSDGDAQTRNGDGTLTQAPSDVSTQANMTMDPYHPVPTRGGGALIAGYESGMFEISDIQDRDDVLVYTSDALAEDMHLLGVVKATIWVSAQSPLTDIAVRLSDVSPSGHVMNVVDTYHSQSTVQQNEPQRIDLTVGYTAYTLAKGHHLRLDIAGSNAPLYDVNLNNGQTSKTGKEGEVAQEHIYHGGDTLSQLILPVNETNGD